MSCKSCQADHQRNLDGEIAIHFPGLKGLDKPIVWVFPKLLVCLNCGFTEFAVPIESNGHDIMYSQFRQSPTRQFHY
jgi:hypothetical protein